MNWRFCVDTPEQRALKLCRGSMNEGAGWGDGTSWGYGGGDCWGYGDGGGNGSDINYGIQPRDGGRSVAGIITGYSPKMWV